MAEVDAALGRVEDALAGRERERVVRTKGAGAWVDQARGEAGRLRAPVHVLRRELQIDPELACRIDALVEAL